MRINKSVLFGASTFISALAFSTAAQAQLELTLGGSYNFEAGITQEDNVVGIDNRPSKFLNETEINADISGSTEYGLDYGAHITLLADLTEDAAGRGTNAAETYLYLSGNFGRVVLGDAVGPEETFRKDGSTFAYGTGGINGDWYYFAAWPTGQEFNVRPGLRLAHGTQDQYGIYSNASKVQYYTPSFAGFQLGVAYTPDVGDRGQLFSGRFNGDAEQVFSFGALYERDIRDFNIALSLLGETGDAESDSINNVSDWGLGGTISYKGFNFGGGYYDWKDSFSVGNDVDAYSWNLGVGYDNASWATSLGYHRSDFRGNMTDLVSLSGEYRLGAGLTPYAEANFFDLDPRSSAIQGNRGEVYILGMNLNF